MILRIDHVSLAVKDYDRAFHFFVELLGAVPGATARDDGMKYRWQLMSLGDLSRLELVTPTGAGSFLDGFLSKKDAGIHHLTLQTRDIRQTAARLDGLGIPYFGFREYGNAWKELFIHPKNAFGVLIQIAEFRADDWLPPELRMPDSKKFSVAPAGGGCSVTFAHPGGGTVSLGLDREQTRELRDALDERLR